MGARTGQEYIDRLGASSPTIEIHGERVTSNVPDHPAFRNVVRTYGQLYDLQHSEPDVLTYT
ncbi:MAG: 4-hydroxyphenylacetate 3-monooxygenase, partial [Solirubrobacteraceae bacterium]|nr:4-hydroxyphenylacetate 3-monooxygenase [Solirubrobacteraceae bacterium]